MAEVITIWRIDGRTPPPPPHGLQEMNVSRDQPAPGFFRSGRATGAEIKPWVRGWYLYSIRIDYLMNLTDYIFFINLLDRIIAFMQFCN